MSLRLFTIYTTHVRTILGLGAVEYGYDRFHRHFQSMTYTESGNDEHIFSKQMHTFSATEASLALFGALLTSLQRVDRL